MICLQIVTNKYITKLIEMKVVLVFLPDDCIPCSYTCVSWLGAILPPPEKHLHCHLALDVLQV